MSNNSITRSKEYITTHPIWKSKGLGTIFVFIILVIFFSIKSDSFLTVNNLLNILWQISTLLIISMGMTWVIISGGIDLSVGAQMGLCGVVSAMAIKNAGFPVYIGFVSQHTCRRIGWYC